MGLSIRAWRHCATGRARGRGISFIAGVLGARMTLLTSPYHSDAFWRVVGRIELALLNAIGAVNLFFVLSGFVLAASIERGPPQIGAAAYRFVMARVFRLFPAIWSPLRCARPSISSLDRMPLLEPIWTSLRSSGT